MKKILNTFFFLTLAMAAKAQTITPDKNAVTHSHLRVTNASDADANDPTKAFIAIQYVDGLGRALQTVGYQQSPSHKDIISGAVKYDAFSRVVQATLPTPSNNGTGAYVCNPTSLAQTFYNGDANPYMANTAFDNSPLNRVRESYGAGQAWQTAGKKIQQFDEIAGSNVRYYYLNSAKDIILSGGYPANTLYQKRIIDEQGHTSIEITDRNGRLIEKDKQDDTGYISICYVYDDMSRLRAIIQPEGYRIGTSFTYNSQDWKNWVFYYEYDGRRRLIAKKIPGANTEYIVYDKWDRIVWSQTALQQESNHWQFTKYDAQNRVILSGEKTDNRSQSQLQTEADGQALSTRFES
jgi:hypothetical protein